MLNLIMLFLTIFITALLIQTGTCKNNGSSIFPQPSLQEKAHLPTYIPLKVQHILGSKESTCGASIISRRHLITAASCIRHTKGPYQVFVSSTNGEDKKYIVDKIQVHPYYIKGNFQNDIALLTLKDRLKFDRNLRRVRLPNESAEDLTLFERSASVEGYIYAKRHFGDKENVRAKENVDGEEKGDATVYGFGETSPNGRSTLQSFNIKKVDDEECRISFAGQIMSESNFCGRCLKNKCHSCQIRAGDSLIRNGELIGIVSHPPSCQVKESIGVFTKIRPFLDFIQRVSSNVRDAKKKKKKPEMNGKTKTNEKTEKNKEKEKSKKDQAFPYYVAVAKKEKKPHCGGTIISEELVVTAGHCFNPCSMEKEKYVVIVGSTKYNKGRQFDLGKIQFSPGRSKNRIIKQSLHCCIGPCYGFGYPKWQWPIKGLNVRAISLPKKGEKFKDGDKADLVSYGLMKRGGKPSTTLQATQISIMDAKKCKKFEKLGDGVLCSDDAKSGRSSCNTDLGAPLVVNNKLIGITLGCIKKNGPIWFENIRHTIHVIEKELKKN